MKSNAWLILSGILFAAVPAIQWSPQSRETGTARSEQMAAVEQRNRSAFAVILGEFRTNMGDLIFLKTERYLDSGVAYAPHIDASQLEASGEAAHDHDHEGHDHGGHAHDEPSDDPSAPNLDKAIASSAMRETAAIAPGQVKQDDHGHGFVPTIIRTADADFRGFIGQMEREVKPWRDPTKPHQHTAGTELLPWYRVGTYSDPYNVRMYIIGAWWLKTLRTEKQLEEALKFLDEGLQHNPGNFQIQYMRGYLMRELKRTDEAQAAFRAAAEAGLQVRPQEWDGKSPEWDITKQEQLEGAMLMDIIHERDKSGTTAALELATRYSELIPPPTSVHRLETSLADEVFGKLE